MFTFKIPTLLKLWMGASALSACLSVYERSKQESDVDPYLSLGKERYDALARFVMLEDRRGFMNLLDHWGLKDMELRMGVWRFIAAKCS